MAVLLDDTFTRANSTTSLGSPTTGGPYTVQAGSGVFGINSNEAYLSTPAVNAQATFPAAINVDASVKIAAAPSATIAPGLMIRWIDINNYWVLSRSASNTYALYRSVGGTLTQVSPDFPAVQNDVIALKAYGDQIAWYCNGRQYGVLTDPFFSVATAVAGIRNGGLGVGRWDDLYVQDQAALFGNWGASPEASSPAPLEFASTSSFTPSLYKGRDTASADESEIP